MNDDEKEPRTKCPESNKVQIPKFQITDSCCKGAEYSNFLFLFYLELVSWVMEFGLEHAF